METLLKTPKDKEQFLLWIDFLKAEVFGKATRKLQNGENYCCLGVGCAVLVPEENLIVCQAFFRKELSGLLPDGQPRAPKWLKAVSLHFKRITGVSVTRLNDRGGLGIYREWTHPEIADKLLEVYADELAAIQ